MPQTANTGLLSLLLLAAAVPAPAQEEGKRVALIVGNDAYSISPLKNAVNDARAMDKALRAAGFRTLLRENGKKAEMDAVIGQFLDMLGPDDTALFFYAGHGVQIDNENFLVPVDFEPGTTISGAKFSCISMARVFDELSRKRAKKNIIILDACRSNPVSQKYSLEAGLAQPQNPGKETYIAFSTGPGQVATDNPDGRNSWFTEALSDLISQPKLTSEINEMFNRVKKKVSAETEGRQTPWTTSNMTGNFYFHAPLNQGADNDPTLAEKWMEDAKAREQREDWAEAIARVDQVIEKKPGGELEEAARARRLYLEARRDAQARFEAEDYAAAATLYSKAFEIDPFAVDAAFQGVNSYLLTDRIPEAVALLRAVRVLGNSASLRKANAELQKLGAVYAEAGEEVKAGIPEPPPIEQMFSGIRFGKPDSEMGMRHLRSTPVDLTRWTRDLQMAAPPAAAPVVVPGIAPGVTPPAGDNPIANAIFHVEIISTGKSRDLVIRKIGEGQVNSSGVRRPGGVSVKVATDPPGADLTVDGDAEQHCQAPCVLNLPPSRQTVRAQLAGFRTEVMGIDAGASAEDVRIPLEQEFGFVQLDGPEGRTAVLVDGKLVSEQVPYKLQLPAGTYEIRAVEAGQILNHQDLEVKESSTVAITVKR